MDIKNNPGSGNSLLPFVYEGMQVRVFTIDGDPWFNARDICEVLDLGNPSQAVARLEEDERGIISTDTPSGPQDMLYVNEAGLYALILGSRKPQAREFKRWVTHEVIPSIRRSGMYLVAGNPAMSLEDLIILQATSVKELKNKVEQVETAALTANRQIQNFKDVLISEDKNWRRWVNEQMNSIGMALGDYQDVKHRSYELLCQRARCNLEQRLKNMRQRMEAGGAARSQVARLNKLDVIEADPRLKEIYTGIVKELYIKYVA
jgi:prophage antirepressor-like protein